MTRCSRSLQRHATRKTTHTRKAAKTVAFTLLWGGGSSILVVFDAFLVRPGSRCGWIWGLDTRLGGGKACRWCILEVLAFARHLPSGALFAQPTTRSHSLKDRYRCSFRLQILQHTISHLGLPYFSRACQAQPISGPSRSALEVDVLPPVPADLH